MNDAIKNIVIIGGGINGWTAAMGLARGLQNQRPRITVIDSKEFSLPKITNASPHIFDFHKILGVHDQHLIQQHQAQVICANEYQNWCGDKSSIFIGNNTHLPVFNGIELHHLLKRVNDKEYSSYSLAAMAAQHHKQAESNEQRGTLLGSFNTGLLLNNQAYLNFMLGAAQHLGVQRTAAAVKSVQKHPETGFIQRLILQNDETLDVDLVIDNSGHQARIMQQELNINYQDDDSKKHFDTLLEIQQPCQYQALNYCRYQMLPEGLLEQGTLNHQQYSLLWANTQQHSLEQLQQTLLVNTEGATANTCNIIQHAIYPGRSDRFFYKNCIVIGDAAGYIGAPAMSNVVLTQRSISRLLDLFPSKACYSSNAHEYNRLIGNDYSEAKDYLDLHCYLATKHDCKNNISWGKKLNALSKQLQQKLMLFSDYGRYEDELNQIITRQNWISLLNLVCQHSSNYEPLLDRFDEPSIKQFLANVRQDIQQQLQKLSLL